MYRCKNCRTKRLGRCISAVGVSRSILMFSKIGLRSRILRAFCQRRFAMPDGMHLAIAWRLARYKGFTIRPHPRRSYLLLERMASTAPSRCCRDPPHWAVHNLCHAYGVLLPVNASESMAQAACLMAQTSPIVLMVESCAVWPKSGALFSKWGVRFGRPIADARCVILSDTTAQRTVTSRLFLAKYRET